MEAPGSIPGTPTAMKKILITSTYFHPYLSGLTLYPLRLAQAWVRQGHEVTAFAFQHDPKLPRQDRIGKIRIKRVLPHLRISKGFVNFFYPFLVFPLISQSDLVIVILPSLENAFVAIIARLLGKQTVTLYLCDVDLKNNLFDRVASLATNLSSGFCCLLANRIINSSADYAGTSPVLKHFLKKTTFQIPPVALSKTDVEYLKRLKLFYPKRPVIGFVGRISHEKNLEVLIEALDRLKKAYPKIKLLCVGPFAYQVAGESKYYLKILRLLNEYDIDYEILGVLNQSALMSFLKFVDVLVLPSNNRTEAFGIVQIEAMLSGTPVVAANLPGIRVPIKLTGMGKLFNGNDSGDLANQIQTVIEKRPKLSAHRLKALFTKETRFF